MNSFWSWYLGEGEPLPNWERTGQYEHIARVQGREVASISLNTNRFSNLVYSLYVDGYVASFGTVTECKQAAAIRLAALR